MKWWEAIPATLKYIATILGALVAIYVAISQYFDEQAAIEGRWIIAPEHMSPARAKDHGQWMRIEATGSRIEVSGHGGW